MRRLANERSRLFDQEAERYDRYRPTYPDPLIDELLGPEPEALTVLDVGCGTGIASRQMAERGAPPEAVPTRSGGFERSHSPVDPEEAMGRSSNHARLIDLASWAADCPP